MAELPDILWAEGLNREPSGRDRRQAERIISYWENKLAAYGDSITIAALDLGNMSSRDWANRFLISVDPVVERSTLIMYGPKFAQLLNLPDQPRSDLPLPRQLPRRYLDLFLRGCREVQQASDPVRLEGEIPRSDGRIEQYRAAFIPVRVKPNSLTCFAFGALNNRIVEAKAAE